jgi:4-amino-4-deoxy-L-arabinose transferase-like glycosyltransferase
MPDVTTGRWGFQRSLALVCLVGFALRVAYVLVYRTAEVPLEGDSFFYSQGANLLAHGKGFVDPYFDPPTQSAAHPPLYLLWLAVASVIDPGSTTSQATHMLWTCVLGTASVFMCGVLGRRVAGARAGLVAAVIAALYPNMWLHDGALLSESMAIFTITLSLWSAYRFWDEPTRTRAALLGFSCALAALSRPEFVLLVPALLIPLAFIAGPAPLKRRLTWMTVGGVTTLATLAPWIAFNFSRFDAPVYLSTNAGGTVSAANCDSTYYGDLIGYKDYGCASEYLDAAAARTPDWDELDAAQQDQAVRRETFRYIGDHVDRLPVVVGARVARVLKFYGVGQEVEYDELLLAQERWLIYAGLASWYAVGCLALVGAVVLWRRRVVPVFPLLAVPAIVLFAVAVTFGQTRYRGPAEPALVVLAAVAVDAALRRRPTEPRAEHTSTAAAPGVEVRAEPEASAGTDALGARS